MPSSETGRHAIARLWRCGSGLDTRIRLESVGCSIWNSFIDENNFVVFDLVNLFWAKWSGSRLEDLDRIVDWTRKFLGYSHVLKLRNWPHSGEEGGMEFTWRQLIGPSSARPVFAEVIMIIEPGGYISVTVCLLPEHRTGLIRNANEELALITKRINPNLSRIIATAWFINGLPRSLCRNSVIW